LTSLVPEREEITIGWKKLHRQELCDLYPLPNMIMVIKSWTIEWVLHMACIEEKRKNMGFW
jgi:hypothetical protein